MMLAFMIAILIFTITDIIIGNVIFKITTSHINDLDNEIKMLKGEDK